jgi:hypothetical protein
MRPSFVIAERMSTAKPLVYHHQCQRQPVVSGVADDAVALIEVSCHAKPPPPRVIPDLS